MWELLEEATFEAEVGVSFPVFCLHYSAGLFCFNTESLVKAAALKVKDT